MNRIRIAIALGALTTGCTSTVSPIVTRVDFAQDGALIVRSCELTISPGAFHPDLSLDECRTERHPAPSP